MSRSRKIKIIIPIVVVLFFAAFAEHRHDAQQLNITGRLRIKEMDEISGIAVSGIRKDIYYIHNDSGDTSRFFAISPDGTIKNVIYFKGDPSQPLGAVDCEDIAVGIGPDKDKVSLNYWHKF